MGSIDLYGAIHIRWQQTSKETIGDVNTDAQWARSQIAIAKWVSAILATAIVASQWE